MKIFLSYPSAHKDTAASICYELQAERHDVFFDREDLPAGQSYNGKIRKAIEVSDLVIFLITPDALAPGRFTSRAADRQGEGQPWTEKRRRASRMGEMLKLSTG